MAEEQTTAKPKRKRNRPDLANFGQEYVEKGDNARYLRHALEAWGLPPIDISDNKQVEERILWYFNHCIEDDMKPTVLGFANALGIDKHTLWKWWRGGSRAETHSPLIKKTYAILEELWEDYMQNGKINPVTGIFFGKNHFGYQDKADVVVRLGADEATIPQEVLEEKYRDMLGDGTIDTTGEEV